MQLSLISFSEVLLLSGVHTTSILPSLPTLNKKLFQHFSRGTSMFHRAFFSSVMDKTPTYALFTQHCISLVCWFL